MIELKTKLRIDDKRSAMLTIKAWLVDDLDYPIDFDAKMEPVVFIEPENTRRKLLPSEAEEFQQVASRFLSSARFITAVYNLLEQIPETVTGLPREEPVVL